jgi:hypothetical protein
MVSKAKRKGERIINSHSAATSMLWSQQVILEKTSEFLQTALKTDLK